MKSKIDLVLISGFLGSGKTTFLKNMLENLEHKKVGVLINEFANTGIDGIIIEKEGLQLVEINNGSIFCSCLKGSFIQALIEFSMLDIDVLLIENSGMADPSNIHQILNEIEGRLNRKYNYKGSVCIVDSISFLKHVQVLAPVQNQIASSNLILINKIDRVNQSTIINIEDMLHMINPTAFIYKCIYSQVPMSILEEKLTDNGYLGETSNQPWNRPSTYSLECEGICTKEKIIDFVKIVENYVQRMKGFIKVSSGWQHIDVVGNDIVVKEATIGNRDIITKSKLVIIGVNTIDFKNIILDAWEATFQVKPQIYCDFDSCQAS